MFGMEKRQNRRGRRSNAVLGGKLKRSSRTLMGYASKCERKKSNRHSGEIFHRPSYIRTSTYISKTSHAAFGKPRKFLELMQCGAMRTRIEHQTQSAFAAKKAVSNPYSLSLLFNCGMVVPVLSVSRPVWA